MGDAQDTLLKFIVQRLERHRKISLQNLSGYLSQLSDEVRESVGRSNQQLLQFLHQHPSTFIVDDAGNVKLAVVDEDQKNIRGSCNSAKESHGAEFPPVITNGKGEVVRISPTFGLIKASQPVKTMIYFDAPSFGDKCKKLIKDCRVSVGQTVCFSAELGPPGKDASYRATKVWIPKYFQITNRDLHRLKGMDISEKEITEAENDSHEFFNYVGEGSVQKIFPKYGIIAVDGDSQNNIFFTENVINYKNVVDLTQVLSVGDIVDYTAVRSTKCDSDVQWEATKVCIRKTEGDSGDETFS